MSSGQQQVLVLVRVLFWIASCQLLVCPSRGGRDQWASRGLFEKNTFLKAPSCDLIISQYHHLEGWNFKLWLEDGGVSDHTTHRIVCLDVCLRIQGTDYKLIEAEDTSATHLSGRNSLTSVPGVLPSMLYLFTSSRMWKQRPSSRSGFKSYLSHLPAEWQWAIYSSLLGLLFCTMKVVPKT